MKKLVLVLMAAVYAAAAFGAEPQWYPVGNGGRTAENACVTTSTEGQSKIVFDVDVPGFMGRDAFTKGGTFRELSLPGETHTEVVGQAKLPVIRRLVEVPEGATLKVLLRSADPVESPISDFGAGGQLLPLQEPVLKTPDGLDRWTFRRDEAWYAADAFLPESPVRLGAVREYRGHRVLELDILPALYNPRRGQLRVYAHLGFDLVMEGGDAAKTAARIRQGWSPAFEAEYACSFVNYGMFEGSAPEEATLAGSWEGILVISDPAFQAAAEPLVQWRRKMGYKVLHVTTATAGTSASAIKSYIKGQFETWTTPALAFVVLVGDTTQIPAPAGAECSDCASDSDYACVSGTDNIPDLYVGRISVETGAQATEVFARFMTYSKAAFTQTPWIKKACFSNSCDSTINSYNTHQYCQLTYTKPGGYTGEFYPAGPDPGGDLIRCIEEYGGNESTSGQKVVEALNHGRSMIVYSGHGGQTGWSGPGVDVSDVQGATSGEMAPFMAGHCCVANSIAYSSPCFGESAMREVAIGYYGSSNNSLWDEDDYLQKAWFKKIFTNHQYRLGEFMTNAMIDLYNNGGTSEKDYYMDMELLDGDPSMELYTEIPALLAVTHENVMMLGANSFQVAVAKAGAPLAGARVCLTKGDGGDDIHEFALTNASGQANIAFSPSPSSVGTLNVTVTAVNAKPYEAAVNVVVPSGPYLSYLSYGLNDSAEGNGDGVLNPGEGGRLSVTVSNIGAEAGTGLTGTLTSADAYVTVTDGAAVFPDIAKDGTGTTSPDHFAFTLASGAPNGHVAAFTLNWTAAGGNNGAMGFTVPVCAPLVISGVTVTELLPTSARVTWTTNLPSSSKVRYGTAVPPGQVSEDAAPVTSHSVSLTGLSSCTTYSFSVESASAGCYTATNPAGGYSTFRTKMAGYALGPDDVEGGAGSWVASGTGSGWHVDTCKSHSGAHAWKAGDAGCPGSYAASTTAYLTSPPMALGAAGHGAQLKFWHWYQLADRGDSCSVQVSTDGGATWGALEFWKGAGSSSGWVQKVYELSAYGGTVLIRFRLVSDASGGGEGWYLDDIEVGSAASCAPDEVGGAPETAVRWTGAGKDAMSWGACAEAAHHHVYRGIPAALPDLLTAGPDSCLKADNVTGTSCTGLGEEPAAGAFFWFLVTGVNAAGLEGSAGTATAGLRDLDSTGGCP